MTSFSRNDRTHGYTVFNVVFAMGVVLTVYVFPRQWYIYDGERLPGPPGLREFNVSPIAEDGTYAAVSFGVGV